MFLFLLILAALLPAVLDLRRYSRLARRGCRPSALHTGLWLVFDLLPFVMPLSYLFLDNTPPAVRTSMWLLWCWLFVQGPRFLYRLLRRLRRPRLGIALAAAVAATMLWGALAGRRNLRTERIECCSEQLPAAFDGFRIALFSDLHLGALVDTEGEVGRLVERINALHPDLVCFTGDLVNIRYTELDATAERLLRGIEAPLFSVLGNHDVGTYIGDKRALPPAESCRRLVERQQAMGWHLLQDTTVYLRRGDDSIALSGLSFDPALRKRRHDKRLPPAETAKCYRDVPPQLFDITLVHLPQYWDQVRAAGYGDLTLSGHTHAMQCRLRFGDGRGWSPARLLYKRWGGRYDADGSTLYINDGVGYVGYPMRLGARPEVTLITLRRCE